MPDKTLSERITEIESRVDSIANGPAPSVHNPEPMVEAISATVDLIRVQAEKVAEDLKLGRYPADHARDALSLMGVVGESLASMGQEFSNSATAMLTCNCKGDRPTKAPHLRLLN